MPRQRVGTDKDQATNVDKRYPITTVSENLNRFLRTDGTNTVENRYVLIIHCNLSKYSILTPVGDAAAQEVAEYCWTASFFIFEHA